MVAGSLVPSAVEVPIPQGHSPEESSELSPHPCPKAHDPVARCGHPLKILTLMMMTANTQAAFSFDMALHTHSTLEHRTLAHF